MFAIFALGVFVGGVTVGCIWAVTEIIAENDRDNELIEKASNPVAHYIGKEHE